VRAHVFWVLMSNSLIFVILYIRKLLYIIYSTYMTAKYIIYLITIKVHFIKTIKSLLKAVAKL